MAKNRTQQAADWIAGECLAVRLRMLLRVVNGIYDDALRPLGLRVGQLNLLVALSKMGETTPTRLGRRLRIETSTLSRDLERMIAAGWLQTLPGDDGRSHRLQATEAGRRLLVDALPRWREAQKQAQRLLDRKSHV